MKKKNEVVIGIFIDPEDVNDRGRTYAIIIPKKLLLGKQKLGGPFYFLLPSKKSLDSCIELAGNMIESYCIKELEKV